MIFLELFSIKSFIIAFYALNVALFPPEPTAKCVMVVNDKCAMYEMNQDGWNTNENGEIIP